MEKHITVVPGEGGQFRDLAILPGTTAANVLQAAGMGEGYVLSTGRGTEALGNDENVYPVVQEGQKLYAVTPVSVGTSQQLLARLTQRILHVSQELRGIQRAKHALVQRTVTVSRSQSPPILVPRDQRPYWMQRGWTQKGRTSTGYFRTRFGSWKGKATTSASGRLDLHIRDPPKVMEQHSHWACFHARSRGWYFIHTYDMEDLSSGILHIEHMLIEAHHVT